jgi:hypothetical protein
MAYSTPELDEWSRLYQAAIRVKEMAPWDWMTESDLFGVENPETGELGFVSVMGTLGEHYAIAVYPGPEGLYGFWALYDAGTSAAPEEVLEIAQLQASFEDRDVLTDRDRGLIKELGLKFRGRQAWPMFRGYRPGYFPWYLEAPEVRFLTHVLEQTVDVAPRVVNHPELLDPTDDEHYLVRVCREDEGVSTWEDRVVEIPEPEPPDMPIPMDVELLKGLRGLPRTQVTLEMDFFLFPARIGERGERPHYLYTLMIVDTRTGLVLGHEMLKTEPTVAAMYGKVPLTVVRHLLGMKMRPTRVRVRTAKLFRLLQRLQEDLGFELECSSFMPTLDVAKDFLMGRFG